MGRLTHITAIHDARAAESTFGLHHEHILEGSRRGQVHHGAAEDNIATEAEKSVKAVTESGRFFNATYQIDAVTNLLVFNQRECCFDKEYKVICREWRW